MDASKIGQKHYAYGSAVQKQPPAAQGKNFAALIADVMGTPEDAVKIAKSMTASKNAVLDSSKGEVGIDAYFAPQSGPIDFDGPNAPPLLMPTARNIEVLAAHAADKLKSLLAANNIPGTPKEISYDKMGQLQLPEDYAYADQFKQLLADHPDMERELRTVNALTSSYTEMQKSLPFLIEYDAASSGAEANAVVAKYSHLFSNNPSYSQIALTFASDGSLVPTADGKPYNVS